MLSGPDQLAEEIVRFGEAHVGPARHLDVLFIPASSDHEVPSWCNRYAKIVQAQAPPSGQRFDYIIVEQILESNDIPNLWSEINRVSAFARPEGWMVFPLARGTRVDHSAPRALAHLCQQAGFNFRCEGDHLACVQFPPAPLQEADETLELSLVLPLFNEEPNVEKVLLELLDGLRGRVRFELIPVDNGSQDATRVLLEELAQKHPEIIPHRVYPNRGFGGGVLAGLARARAQAVAHMAGDGQVSAADLLRTFEAYRSGRADMTKVCREKRHDGWQRWVVTRIWNWLFSLAFRWRVRDANGSPKIFARKHLDWMDLQHTDWFLDAEMLLKFHERGLTVHEVPIEFLPRGGGKSKVRASAIVEFLKNIARHAWRLRRQPRDRARV